MHPRILAQRDADAQTRIVNASTKLAAKLKLNTVFDFETARNREPAIQAMQEKELIAEFMEKLLKHEHEEQFEQEKLQVELPPDFPGRTALLAAGLSTLDDLKDKPVEELMSVPGIGETTANKIVAALSEQ